MLTLNVTRTRSVAFPSSIEEADYASVKRKTAPRCVDSSVTDRIVEYYWMVLNANR